MDIGTIIDHDDSVRRLPCLPPQVPDGFTAVMSASKGEHRMADNTFLFTMEQPIPSYLVALAVGDLVSAEVGPR